MRECRKWRVVITDPAPAGFNMSVDEALLKEYVPGISSPVIRFYSWEPSGISIGRNQNPAEILDVGKCIASDIAIVRRITGGGMIFHSSELTYSMVCSPSDIPEGYSVADSFRYLTAFLMMAYQRIGLSPEYAVSSGSERMRSADFCFAGHERYDILVNGKKLGGNAQKRLKDRIILHGSIPVVNMSAKGATFLLSPENDIESHTTALQNENISTSIEEVISILSESFSDCMRAELVMCGLNEKEILDSEYLLRTKYSSESWNMYGVESKSESG